MSSPFVDPSSFLVLPEFAEPFAAIRDAGEAGPDMDEVLIASYMRTANEHLSMAIAHFDKFLAGEQRWRMAVFQGTVEYDGAIEQGMKAALATWVACMDRVFSVLPGQELFWKGRLDEGLLQELGDRHLAARSMLTPDDEFFEGEHLDRLASEAITDDDRGETVEMRTMGA